MGVINDVLHRQQPLIVTAVRMTPNEAADGLTGTSNQNLDNEKIKSSY